MLTIFCSGAGLAEATSLQVCQQVGWTSRYIFLWLSMKFCLLHCQTNNLVSSTKCFVCFRIACHWKLLFFCVCRNFTDNFLYYNWTCDLNHSRLNTSFCNTQTGTLYAGCGDGNIHSWDLSSGTHKVRMRYFTYKMGLGKIWINISGIFIWFYFLSIEFQGIIFSWSCNRQLRKQNINIF